MKPYCEITPDSFSSTVFFFNNSNYLGYITNTWYYRTLGAFGNLQTICTYVYCQFAGEWYRIGLADESPLFAKFKNQLMVSKGLLVSDANGNVNLTMWSMRCTLLDRTLFYIYIISPPWITKGKHIVMGKCV